MKKSRKYVSLILLILVAVGFSSCRTSVRVSYMSPASVNMGPYKNIAIASTVPYSGRLSYPTYVPVNFSFSFPYYIKSSYSSNLPEKTANYATNQIVSSLSSTNFFDSIMGTKQTDAILNYPSYKGNTTSDQFRKLGVDAVIIPKITSMNVNEYIYSEKKIVQNNQKPSSSSANNKPSSSTTTVSYDYYKNINCSMTLTVTVISTKTNSIIATKSYNKSSSFNSDFNPLNPYFSTTAEDLFRSMIRQIQSEILSDFIPARITTSLDLMDNKPKNKDIEEYYKMAEKGNLLYSLEGFKENFEKTGNVVSGYNAAVLYAALNRYDEALTWAKRVYDQSGNSKVYALYSRLSSYLKQTREAQSQLDGSENSGTTSSSGPVPEKTIYDYVIGN